MQIIAFETVNIFHPIDLEKFYFKLIKQYFKQQYSVGCF